MQIAEKTAVRRVREIAYFNCFGIEFVESDTTFIVCGLF